ncbi:hypothetical protein LJK88_08575 [Paenibacillus sp. P26]|nr:hypothetical protein LJK88_08575 [Paenibacillus sp. P26]
MYALNRFEARSSEIGLFGAGASVATGGGADTSCGAAAGASPWEQAVSSSTSKAKTAGPLFFTISSLYSLIVLVK